MQAVLEATSNAHIASHILHLLCHCFSRADAPTMSLEQMQRERRGSPLCLSRVLARHGPPCFAARSSHAHAQSVGHETAPCPGCFLPTQQLAPALLWDAVCAQRLVDEIAAHKHHLQVRRRGAACCPCAVLPAPVPGFPWLQQALLAGRVFGARGPCRLHLALAAQNSPGWTLLAPRSARPTRLQDAAQYALGNLMAVVLGDARVSPPQRQRHVSRLLEELRAGSAPGQCQGEAPLCRAQPCALPVCRRCTAPDG